MCDWAFFSSKTLIYRRQQEGSRLWRGRRQGPAFANGGQGACDECLLHALRSTFGQGRAVRRWQGHLVCGVRARCWHALMCERGHSPWHGGMIPSQFDDSRAVCLSTKKPVSTFARAISVIVLFSCLGFSPLPSLEDAPAPDALHSFKADIVDGKIQVTAKPSDTLKENKARFPTLRSGQIKTAGGAGVVIVGGGAGALHTIDSLREVGIHCSPYLIILTC